MQRPFRVLLLPALLFLTMGVGGCTLFPEKNPPTLASTTSAEQYERIFWQMVQKQQWAKVSPLLSATLVWHVEGKALQHSQVLPYLQSLSLRDAAIRDVSVQPNGQDMTVSCHLELSPVNGPVQEFAVLSVWQQIKGGGYMLVAHSQQPAAGSAGAGSAP